MVIQHLTTVMKLLILCQCLKSIVKSLVLGFIRYSLQLTQADMRQEVEEYLPSLSEWAKHYLHTSPQAGQKELTLKL